MHNTRHEHKLQHGRAFYLYFCNSATASHHPIIVKAATLYQDNILFPSFIALLPLLSPPVNCGIPVAPTNGSIVTVPSTLGGTEILYRCDTGFVPTGNMTAVCTSDGISPNGTWTPKPATIVCIGK